MQESFTDDHACECFLRNPCGLITADLVQWDNVMLTVLLNLISTYTSIVVTSSKYTYVDSDQGTIRMTTSWLWFVVAN